MNKLLFADERVVAESTDDLWKQSSPPPVYSNSTKALAFFSVILFHSPFGPAIMDSKRETDLLCSYFERLQRFCYKLCEIRKAECEFRYRYYRLWADKKTRDLYLKKHPQIALPCFKRRTGVQKIQKKTAANPSGMDLQSDSEANEDSNALP